MSAQHAGTSARPGSSENQSKRPPSLQLGDLPEECLNKIFQHASFHVTHVTDDYQPYPLLYPDAHKLPRLSRRFYDTASNALWRYVCVEDTKEGTALRLAGLGNSLDALIPAVKTGSPSSKPPADRVRGIRLFLDDTWIARDTFKRTLALIIHVCPRLSIGNLAGAWVEEPHLLPSLSSAFANRHSVQDLRLHLYHNSMVVQWQSVAELLALMPSLKYLDIDAQVSEEGANAMDQANLGELLHLRSSCLPPDAALRLLKKTPRLKIFHWIVHGPWTDQTTGSLRPGEMPNLANLQVNTEYVHAPSQLADMLGYFPHLQALTLECTSITDRLMLSIPSTVRSLSFLSQRGSPWIFLRWLADAAWLQCLERCEVLFEPDATDEAWDSQPQGGKRHRRPGTTQDWHDFVDLQSMLVDVCSQRPRPLLDASFQCV